MEDINVQECLNTLTDYKSGELLCKALALKFNRFSSGKSLTESIYGGLTSLAKERYDTCMSLAAMDLGIAYRPDSVWADERMLASQKFAADNLGKFKERLKSRLGFLPRVDEDAVRQGLSYSAVISRREFADAGLDWCRGFVTEWNRTHPTLRQSIFGGWVNAVLLGDGREMFEPDTERGVVAFPFI